MEEDQVKVLVIDDDEVDRLTLRRALKKSEIKHELTECGQAQDAFDLLKNNRYDCIFLDYLLPGTDGLAVLRKFRQEGIKTPIIIITSQGDEKVAVEMMKSGASDYIVKDHIDAINIKKIVQTVTHLREIEKQREVAEYALKISEARLSEAQKIARIGNWEFTTDFEEVYWSEEMYNIFEVEMGKYMPESKHHLEYFHPDEAPVIQDGLKKAQEGIPFNCDLRILKPDGTYKYVNIQAYYQQDAKTRKEKFIGTVQDIDERKQAEHELVEAKKFAEESGKIKEQFLANMSHEIRTPLNAIVGFSNLLLSQQNNFTEENHNYLKAIHQASEHLLAIINDILDFSKIESGKMLLEELDFSLYELINSALDLFRYKAKEKHIELIHEIQDGVPTFLAGDPVRLNQILVNLLSNAIKFTNRGHVKLVIKPFKQSTDSIFVQFIVEDTGIGIPHDKLSTIFDSFTQATSDTTRKYGGTGLGLTIVKKLIELQDGEIAVTSKLGEGTAFSVIIPFEKAKSDQRKINIHTDLTLTNAYPKDIKVLMAEDNELNQVLSKSIFKKIGWELELADNGKMAVEKLQHGKYDIVLMDIQMPEMDGYQATLAIRNDLKPPLSEIPIIAITAHALNSELKKCMEAGMNDYISKPFKIENLIKKVSAAVKRKNGKEIGTEQPLEKIAEEDENVVDLKKLMEFSGNDEDTIKVVINMFITQMPGNLADLQKLLQEQNWVALKNLVHKMKSSYAIIGAQTVKEYLETIEEDCMKNNINAAKFESLVNLVVDLNQKIVTKLNDFRK